MNDDAYAWPPSAEALRTHSLCPQCFTSLRSEVCTVCGIELTGPDALTLASLGDAVVAAELTRSRFLSGMRQRQAIRAAARDSATAAAPAAPAPLVDSPAPPVADAALRTPATPSTGSAVPSLSVPDSARPRVQVLLLTLGITLIGVAAVFFTTLAYLFTSPELRAAILALAAVAVTGIAAALLTRVPRTAHFLSALGVIILVIDAGMIRGFELFGTAAIDPLVFLGLVATALCLLTAALAERPLFPAFRMMSLAFAPIAGFGLAQVIPDWPMEQSFWLGFVAATATTSLWAAVMRPRIGIERSLTLGFQLGAAVLATTLAWGLTSGSFSIWRGDGAALTITTLIGTVALWVALAVQLRGALEVRCAAIMAGLVLSLAVVRVRPMDFGWGTVVLALVGAALPVAAALLAQRLPRWRIQLRFGAFAMLVVAAAGAFLIILGALARAAGGYPSVVSLTTELTTTSRFSVGTDGLLAVGQQSLLLFGSIALIGLALHRLGLGVRLLPGFLALAAGTVLGLAVEIDARASGNPFDSDTGLRAVLLLAASALGIAVLPRLRAGAAHAVAASAIAVFLCYTLATAPSFAPIWCVVAAIIIALLLFWRAVIDDVDPRRLALRRSLLSGAALGVTVVAGLLLGGLGHEFLGDPFGAAPVVITIALLAGAAVVATARREPGPERTVLAALDLVILAIAVAVYVADAHTRTSSTATALLALGLSALLGVSWQLRATLGRSRLRPYYAALATTAGCAFALVLTEERGWSLPVPLGLYLLLFVLVARVLPRGTLTGPSRTGWELPLVLTALALLLGSWTDPRTGWLGYGLVAVAALIAASDDDGGVQRTPRVQLSWIAVPAGAAMLWTYLAYAHVPSIEAYSVPVGLGLVVLGLALTARDHALTGARGRTTLVLGGVAMALIPSAVVGIVGTVTRPILVTIAGFVLLAVVILLPASLAGLRLRAGLLGIAASATALAPAYRAMTAQGSFDAPRATDGWVLVLLALTAAILALASLERRRDAARMATTPAPGTPFATLAYTLGWVATLVSAIVIFVTVLDPSVGVLRPLTATVIYALLAAWAMLVRPAQRELAAVGASAALMLALLGIVQNPGIAPELFTAPVALIGLLAGVTLLHRSPQRRTLPTLGVPLALLLVPSLLLSWAEPELWRLVGLGVVAIAVVIAGAALSWQAPLAIGGAVLLVHALVQLFPAIRSLYDTVPWGVWAALGGVVLVAFGATYEARMRQARALGRRVAALR